MTFILTLPILVWLLARPHPAGSQKQPIAWSSKEGPIAKDLDGLRQMPDDARARTTRQLAAAIRQLPVTPNKLRLAVQLASLSTEGDFGHDALQEVATTLADSLREQPIPSKPGQPAVPYVELAQLVRYEHVQSSLDDPQFATAMSKIDADDERRQGWGMDELHAAMVKHGFSRKDFEGEQFVRLRTLKHRLGLLSPGAAA